MIFAVLWWLVVTTGLLLSGFEVNLSSVALASSPASENVSVVGFGLLIDWFAM